MEDPKFSFFLPPIGAITDSSGRVLKYGNQTPKKSVTLSEVYDLIRNNDELRGLSEEMSLLTGDTPEDIHTAKGDFKREKLPFVTFGGEFDYRKIDATEKGKRGLLSISGLICIDIDSRPKKKEENYVQLTEGEVENLKTRMSEDEELGAVLLFRSPSQDGLKVVVSLANPVNTKEDFKRAYSALEKYILQKYHMITDSSRSDLDGACFLCHDSDAVLRTGGESFDFERWGGTEAQFLLTHTGGKMEDPTLKDGIVGTFCRAYSISEAISKFLPDVYSPEGGNRYTFVGGSSKKGVVVYEDKFACSHHQTDPASGEHNSFDLVRIHKFGSLDSGEETDVTDCPSFKKMMDFVLDDEGFKIQQMKEDHTELPDTSSQSPLLNDWKNLSQKVKKSLQEGKLPEAVFYLKTQLERIEAVIPEEEPDWLLTPQTEENMLKEESSLPEGLVTGYQFKDRNNGSLSLELGAGCLTGFVAPTNHGKTLMLLNLCLNCARRYPNKKFVLLTYEQRANLILQYLLNIYLEDMKLGETSTNRRVIRGYYQYNRSTKYFIQDKVTEFERRKREFFREYIESGRILIKYINSDCPSLCKQLSYLSKKGIGGVFVDYMQFIPKDPRSRVASRQEELKQICIALKDVANDTGLPIILACQFNRTVGCCLDLSPTQVGEAGDIERIMSEMYGMWNFGKKETRPLSDKEQHSPEYTSLMKKSDEISGNSAVNLFSGNQGKDTTQRKGLLIEVLKAREIPTGFKEILTLYPETGRILPNMKESNLIFDEDLPE